MMASPSCALLALDTSSEYCSVALAVLPGNPQDVEQALKNSAEESSFFSTASIFFRHEVVGPQSGARILPAVQEVLDEAGLPLSACIAIAVGRGPGAFTGLRTATSVAQGLAFGLNIPVIPVCTLMACAQAARAKDPAIQRVLATIDARMDEVYWACFEWQQEEEGWKVISPPALCKPEEVPIPSTPFALVGRAIEEFGTRLQAYAQADKVDIQINAQAHAHAVHIASLAWTSWRLGQHVTADKALPLYVRNQVVQKKSDHSVKSAG